MNRTGVLSMAAALLLGACAGQAGPAGTSTLVDVVQEPAGAQCPSGGQAIQSGLDDNGNGQLNPSEVVSTTYVCNGAAGGAGLAGLVALVSTAVEPAGANCPAGGTVIRSGLDGNADGSLQAGEVLSTAFACHGPPGSAGAPGPTGPTGPAGGTAVASLVRLEPVPAGGTCPAGGTRVLTGLDANGNGVLDAGEVVQTSLVCSGEAGAQGPSGAPGHQALVSTVAEAPGANCPFGGVAITAGIDADDDGALQAGEISTRSYVCNGGSGPAGAGSVSGSSSGLTASAGSAAADGVALVGLTATARDAAGGPLAGQVVFFSVTGSDNQLTAATAVTDGAGEAFVGLASTRAEAKLVTATIAGVLVEATAVVSFVAGPAHPARSDLLAAPAAAEPGERVALLATVRDLFDNPVAGAAVTLSAPAGAALEQPAQPTDAFGHAAGAVTSAGIGAYAVEAWVGGAIVASAEVAFSPPMPSATLSTVTVTPAVVPADGMSAAEVLVTVLDGQGRALPGAFVVPEYLDRTAERFPAKVSDGGGRAAFTVTSLDAARAPVRVTVVTGGRQVQLAAAPTLEFYVPTYTVGGTITGLTTSGLVLATPGQADLPVSAGATGFAFATPVVNGTAYDVTIRSQPAGLLCTVADGAGEVRWADVGAPSVTCVSGWTDVWAGAYVSAGRRTDGTVWTWGDNQYGQLGTGGRESASVPVQLGEGFVSISFGLTHTLGLKGDGTLWAWGENDAGQLGDGTFLDASTPVLVGGGYVAVAAGYYASFGLRADGTLMAWGDNSLGQLGDGTNDSRSAPAPVGVDFTAVTACAYGPAFGLRSDGSLWGWGATWTVPGFTVGVTPTQLGSGFKAITAGYEFLLATAQDGSLWGLGSNLYGQFGNGTYDSASTLTQVGAGYSQVVAGGYFAFGVTPDGALWGWGDNWNHQLGVDVTYTSPSPVMVGSGFSGLAAGLQHTLAVRPDGTLWSWGSHGWGQLGTGGELLRHSPGVVGGGFVQVVASGQTMARQADGSTWAWGNNIYYQVADGTRTDRSTPFLLGGPFVDLATGRYLPLAKRVDGTWAVWGNSYRGMGGTGVSGNQVLPAPVDASALGAEFVTVAASRFHAMGLKADGSLWTWGYNYYGQLGVGDPAVTDSATPIQIAADVVSIAAGYYHALAVKSDGTLLAWGDNEFGQVGEGGLTPRAYAPVAIGTGFVSVGAGLYHSLAVKADGTLWTWGYNLHGQLGDGTTLDVNTPTRIGAGFKAATGGNYHSLAVKTDDSLWAWGWNARGQVGDGTGVDQLQPVKVMDGVVSFAAGTNHSVAVQADGTLLTWGANYWGQLGNGLELFVTAPRQVP